MSDSLVVDLLSPRDKCHQETKGLIVRSKGPQSTKWQTELTEGRAAERCLLLKRSSVQRPWGRIEVQAEDSPEKGGMAGWEEREEEGKKLPLR